MCSIDNSEGQRIWIFRLTGQAAPSAAGGELPKEALLPPVPPGSPRCSSKEGCLRPDPAHTPQPLKASPQISFPSPRAPPPPHPLGPTPSLSSPRPFAVQFGPAFLPASRDACSTDSPRSRASQGEVNLEARELSAWSRPRQNSHPPVSASLGGLRARQGAYNQARVRSRPPETFRRPTPEPTLLCAPSSFSPSLWAARRGGTAAPPRSLRYKLVQGL